MAVMSRAPEVETVAAIFLTLTWISTCMRCYVKGFMAKSFAVEDGLAICAQLLFTATAATALKGIAHSMGLHLVDIPIQNLTPAMMYWFATELCYVVTTCALKMSIAVFLLRIATQKSHKIILYLTMGIVMVVTIVYFFFMVFQCSPVSYFWKQFFTTSGSCLPAKTVGAMTYTHSAMNAGVDVVLSGLPVLIVSRLQMNPRTKIIVSTILSLGIIACIATIVRIPYVKILVDNAKDFLYSSTDVVIWTAIEPGLGITAANMATLRPLFATFFSQTKLWSTTTMRNKSAYGHSKSTSGFSNRKGYMRSGSGGADELGLRTMSKNGVITIVEAKEESYDAEPGDSRSKERTQGRDECPRVSNEEDLASQGNTSNEWLSGIRKTVRTEILSEPGEREEY